jgi:hypothetical protein
VLVDVADGVGVVDGLEASSYALPAAVAILLSEFSSYDFLKVEVSHESVPSNCAFCQIDVGGMMMRLGGVKSEFTSSSVWRDTQSMRKSGNPEIRLLFSLTILSNVSGFARSILISTLAAAPSAVAPFRERSGPADALVRGVFVESAL